MRRLGLLLSLALLTATLVAPVGSSASDGHDVPGRIHVDALSSGGRAWWSGPQGRRSGEAERPREASSQFASSASPDTNVDANDPRQDLATGQSETAVAASGQRVLAAWNDATGFYVQPSTDLRASLTGVGFSADGGRTFTDLQGLPNDDPRQQWFGDPAIVALDGGRDFVVASLYLPAVKHNCSEGSAFFLIAVAVAHVDERNQVAFTNPIPAAFGGDACRRPAASDLALLDKPWLAYDPVTRTLALSYTRFFTGAGGQSGDGQIEVVRAIVPPVPRQLGSSDFSRPLLIWPEEQEVWNNGTRVAVAPNGDMYVVWERNLGSNDFNGDPYVYIHAALVPRNANAPSVGSRLSPRVVTLGQTNSNGLGGVKSLSTASIPGDSRGAGNDFPALALHPSSGRVLVVWNDASLHALGDVWLRALPMDLQISGPIQQLNDDDSGALHYLPALSVRADGSIATSWYDRRRAGPTSTSTDYVGEIRPMPEASGQDFLITTVASDWDHASSVFRPNFGDYTDNTSTGDTTYFIWSDARTGVPQPFVDRR